MKIRAIESFPVESNLIVRVATDDGLYGVGESGVAVQVPATRKVLEYYAEWLVGRDPMDIEGLWQEMFRWPRRKEGSLLCAALAGIDMALWDIKGKALGAPVWQLLGGKAREKVPLYAHIRGHSIDEAVEASQAAVESGFAFLRFGFDDPESDLPASQKGPDWDLHRRAGHPIGGAIFHAGRAIRHSARMMEAVREAVGDEIELCIDVHQRLNPARAVEYCNAIAPLRPFFVEDPIRPEDPIAYRQVRSRTSVPLASGENLYSKWQFRPLIEGELVDYLRVDLGAAGGITESRKIAALGETHYLETVPHCARGPLLEQATLHFSVATSNLAAQEHTGGPEWWHDILPGLAEFGKGWAEPPSKPGLGVEFVEEAAKARPPVQRHMPRWRAPDGAVQDW